MLELWKARRARKAAVSTLAPMIERTRFRRGRFAENDWLDAYMVGFLVMLITLIAQRRVSSLQSDTLGIVQADAWAELTGLPGELVGEETCLLSSIGHRDFERGCENAVTMMNAMIAHADQERGRSSPFAGDYSTDELTNPPPGLGDSDHDRHLQNLWRDYFESPMTLSPIQAAQRDAR